MRADEVEVVDVIAEPVYVGSRLQTVAQLEPEIDAALAVAVHRLEAHLHHRLGDRARIPVAGAVQDLELHDRTFCCCC